MKNVESKQQMTTMQIAEDFVNYFNVDDVFVKYDYWKAVDLPNLEKKRDTAITKLKAGGLKKDARKKIRIMRDSLSAAINSTDPRRFSTNVFDDWMKRFEEHVDKLSTPELNEARSRARSALYQAVNNIEEYQESGLISFMVDFEGSSLDFRIKTIADYSRDTMNGHGDKTEKSLTAKKRLIEKNMLLMEAYDEVPADIKMMSSLYLDHSIELSIRIARLQDEMLKKTIGSFNTSMEKIKMVSE